MTEQRITINGQERLPDRRELRFPYHVEEVQRACSEKATHHRGREEWWRTEKDLAEEELRSSMQLREHEVTGGKRVAAVFDEEKQQRVTECNQKITSHEQQAKEYESWAHGLNQMVKINPLRIIELSPDDVRYFALTEFE